MTTTGHVSRSFYVLQALGCRAFARLLFSMLFSVNHYYVLGKSLSELPAASAAGNSAVLVPLGSEDMALLQQSLQTLEPEDKREVLARLLFYWSGFKNCYAVRKAKDLAYLQWIVFPAENGTISSKYRRKFYPLAPQQVMVENAFTFPRYRGRGILFEGTVQLLQLARDEGYKWAICYIRKDRIASLNEFQKMGFRITRMVTEFKVLGWVWRTL